MKVFLLKCQDSTLNDLTKFCRDKNVFACEIVFRQQIVKRSSEKLFISVQMRCVKQSVTSCKSFIYHTVSKLSSMDEISSHFE